MAKDRYDYITPTFTPFAADDGTNLQKPTQPKLIKLLLPTMFMHSEKLVTTLPNSNNSPDNMSQNEH